MLCPICNNLEPIVISIIRLTKNIWWFAKTNIATGKTLRVIPPFTFFLVLVDKHTNMYQTSFSILFSSLASITRSPTPRPPSHTPHRPRPNLFHHLHHNHCIYHMTHKFDILWEIYDSVSSKRGRVKKMCPGMRFQKWSGAFWPNSPKWALFIRFCRKCHSAAVDIGRS